MPDTNNPFDQLAALGYDASDDAVAEMAMLAAAGDAVVGRVGGAYLRVLIKRTQNSLTGVAHPDPSIRETALSGTIKYVYPHVLRGVTTADVANEPGLTRAERSRRALERNRRSNFARTSAACVRAYIRAGGELERIVVGEITKSALIVATATLKYVAKRGEPAPASATERRTTNDTETSVNRALRHLIRSLRRVNDPERREFLAEECRDKLLQTCATDAPDSTTTETATP